MRLLIVVSALMLLLAAPRPAPASDETCVQCKHVDCLRGTIKRKRAMASGYDALARRFGIGWTRDGVPRMEIDWSTYTDPVRLARDYLEVKEQHKALNQAEEELSERVGSAAGCDVGSIKEAYTDIETCTIQGLPGAMAESPCKRLGELLAAHEGIHQASCEVRAGNTVKLVEPATGRYLRDMPSRYLTPAGRATEEARAYRMEADALEAELKKAQEKCETSFNGANIDCTIPTPMGDVILRDEISARACGNPVTANWVVDITRVSIAPMIGTQRKQDPPFDNDCVLKGSPEETRRAALYANSTGGKGWMCVYDPGDGTGKPTITIRNFRLPQCKAPSEQAVTVPAVRAECKEQAPPQQSEPPAQPERPVS